MKIIGGLCTFSTFCQPLDLNSYDLIAIAEVLNYLFRDKNITAKVAQQNDCLRIILTGNDIPDQQSSIVLIQQTMMKLELKSIHRVIVYGQQINQSAISWEQSLDVSYIVPTKPPNNPDENQEKSARWFQWTPWFPYGLGCELYY